MGTKKKRSKSQPASVKSSGTFNSKSSGHTYLAELDSRFKPIKIFVYKNGDAFSAGIAFTIARRYHMHWMKFLDDLTNRLGMDRAVNFLFTVKGKEVHSFAQLKDGKEYVGVDTKFKWMEYGKASQMATQWSKSPRPDNNMKTEFTALDSDESLDIYLRKMGFTTREGNPDTSYTAVKPKEPKTRVYALSPSKKKPPRPKAKSKSPEKKVRKSSPKRNLSPEKKLSPRKPKKDRVKKVAVKKKKIAKRESLSKSNFSEGDEPQIGGQLVNPPENRLISRSPSPMGRNISQSNPVTRENSALSMEMERAKSKQSVRLSNFARRSSSVVDAADEARPPSSKSTGSRKSRTASRSTTASSKISGSISTGGSGDTRSRSTSRDSALAKAAEETQRVISAASDKRSRNSLASTALSNQTPILS